MNNIHIAVVVLQTCLYNVSVYLVLTVHVNYLLRFLRDSYTLVEGEARAAGIPTGREKCHF